MSNEENNKDSLAEIKQEVAVTPEDCAAAFDFWKHFNITPIPGMKEAFDAFIAEPTFEHQEAVKFYVCKAISETQHEAFKDPLFEKIVQECADVSFDIQFDKDLEQVLTSNAEDSAPAKE
jgi:hypothetical protein